MADLTLNDLATLVGLISGTVGAVLGVLNHLRNAYKVIVELQWDMDATNAADLDPNKKWGVIRVSNIGRRPAYVSHVALGLPKGYEDSHLILMEGLQGQKLEEGAPPLTYPVDQEGLEKYGRDWRDVRAQVSDATGKVWRSPKKRRESAPSWAKQDENS